MPSLAVNDGHAGPVVLVLASGRGERFRASGGALHKLRAPLAGRAVIDRTLDAVSASGLPWHVEDAGHAGMGDSIAAAVRATAAAPGWLVLPADLPLILPGTLRAVAAALVPEGAAQPVHAGERGHPVGFGRLQREALLALSGPQGAAAVLRALRAAGQVVEVAVDDAGVLADIDTLDDLARAETLWRARHPGGAAGGEKGA